MRWEVQRDVVKSEEKKSQSLHQEKHNNQSGIITLKKEQVITQDLIVYKRPALDYQFLNSKKYILGKNKSRNKRKDEVMNFEKVY